MAREQREPLNRRDLRLLHQLLFHACTCLIEPIRIVAGKARSSSWRSSSFASSALLGLAVRFRLADNADDWRGQRARTRSATDKGRCIHSNTHVQTDESGVAFGGTTARFFKRRPDETCSGCLEEQTERVACRQTKGRNKRKRRRRRRFRTLTVREELAGKLRSGQVRQHQHEQHEPHVLSSEFCIGMKKGLIASIDQGTSSTRVVVYDAELRAVRSASRGLKTLAPQPGWLQMDASDILASVDACLEEACSGLDVALVGITNQVTSVFARSSRFFFFFFFLSFFLSSARRPLLWTR
jgi:hypothetical protein